MAISQKLLKGTIGDTRGKGIVPPGLGLCAGL